MLKLFGIRAPGHYEMDAPESIWTNSFSDFNPGGTAALHSMELA